MNGAHRWGVQADALCRGLPQRWVGAPQSIEWGARNHTARPGCGKFPSGPESPLRKMLVMIRIVTIITSALRNGGLHEQRAAVFFYVRRTPTANAKGPDRIGKVVPETSR